MSAALSGVLLSIFLVFILILHDARFSSANGSKESVENGTLVAEEMVPYIEPGKRGGEKVMMMLDESRRKLGSFQICALCTCCGGANHYCVPTPCCYAINCNIPNRPFGFCSFTPKTCNCLGCHL